VEGCGTCMRMELASGKTGGRVVVSKLECDEDDEDDVSATNEWDRPRSFCEGGTDMGIETVGKIAYVADEISLKIAGCLEMGEANEVEDEMFDGRLEVGRENGGATPSLLEGIKCQGASGTTQTIE